MKDHLEDLGVLFLALLVAVGGFIAVVCGDGIHNRALRRLAARACRPCGAGQAGLAVVRGHLKTVADFIEDAVVLVVAVTIVLYVVFVRRLETVTDFLQRHLGDEAAVALVVAVTIALCIVSLRRLAIRIRFLLRLGVRARLLLATRRKLGWLS